jgi:benzoyl-CoA 2,3-dioxygenase component B
MSIEHSNIDYSDLIPNNVGLSDNRRLQRALESWQPNYIKWWQDLGPNGSTKLDVYLRTAISVEADGWANFGYVKMPEYRWGIFLAKPNLDRKIPFGDHLGQPVWQDVPGEYRSQLRRLIVTQGDTEPASVEQQNHLGGTCPSLYDLRNLFQINVEEGRHLWAMVYLLHAYFGRDGREEAEMLLERHSGDADKPRILGAFNEPTPDWLSYYMFTYFTDRDGKYQLAALSESGFDPLARTCQFMLTEEAHHMFVGETGIMRVAQRTCEVMKEVQSDEPKKVQEGGGIDLETIQRYINLHYTVSLDLFGQEISTNAATYFNSGLKGRFQESRLTDNHQLTDSLWPVHLVEDGRIILKDRPALNAVNERLRDDYIKDSQRGVARWNQVLESHGVEFRFTLPHRFFNRHIGTSAGINVTPEGQVVPEDEWHARQGEWLPTTGDEKFIESLMHRVIEPGKIAAWIAPPVRGINGKPWDYEYIRFN